MNQSAQNWTAGNRGTAMIAAMFCLLLTSLTAASMSILVKQQLNMGRLLMARNQAKEIAEGALSQALADMSLSPTKTLSAGVMNGALGEGTYDVTLTPISGNLSVLAATGTVDTIGQTIKTYVLKPTFYLALNKGIFSNDYIDVYGNGTIYNGTHSNTWSQMQGNCTIATGSMDSVGISDINGAACVVSGIIRSGVSRLTMPQLDFSYYNEIAIANNQVRTGPCTITGDITPPGGVIWVVGDVTLKKCTINGSVFATGSIQTQGQSSVISPSNKFPALASVNGIIDFQGGSLYKGMVYAKTGYVDCHGNCTIKGSIIAFGFVLCHGNWGVLDYEASDPILLDDPKVHVLAWEQ